MEMENAWSKKKKKSLATWKLSQHNGKPCFKSDDRIWRCVKMQFWMMTADAECYEMLCFYVYILMKTFCIMWEWYLVPIDHEWTGLPLGNYIFKAKFLFVIAIWFHLEVVPILFDVFLFTRLLNIWCQMQICTKV